jgi:hypothetical protein
MKKNDYEMGFPIPGTKQYDYTSLMVDSIYPSPVNSFVNSVILHIYTKQIEDKHPVNIGWFSNGVKINCTSNTLDLSQLTGVVTIDAILDVSSEFIINPNYKTIDKISWVLNLQSNTEKIFSVNSKGIATKVKQLGNRIYLVPKSQYQSFRVNDLLGRNVPFKITCIKTDYIMVELKDLADNRYIIRY